MGAPVGRADYLAPGDWNALCSMCGRKRKASVLVRHWNGMYRCPEHREVRHPQDFVRGLPDAQTPAWVQRMGDKNNGVLFISITESGADLSLYDLMVAAGGQDSTSTVIFSVQPTVTLTGLVAGAGWDAGTTVYVNNYGNVTTGAVADQAFTVRNFQG